MVGKNIWNGIQRSFNDVIVNASLGLLYHLGKIGQRERSCWSAVAHVIYFYIAAGAAVTWPDWNSVVRLKPVSKIREINTVLRTRSGRGGFDFFVQDALQHAIYSREALAQY